MTENDKKNCLIFETLLKKCESEASNKINRWHIVWKLLKMSHFIFINFGIFHQFLSY